MEKHFVKTEIVDSKDFNCPCNCFLTVVAVKDGIRLIVKHRPVKFEGEEVSGKIVSNELITVDDWKKYKKWVLKSMIEI